MDPAGMDGSSHGGDGSPHFQGPCRNFAPGTCRWESSCQFAYNGRVSQVYRCFRQGSCFYGDRCNYRHLQPPSRMEWGRRHSEPHASLPRLGLTRRASEPTSLPSVAVGWAWTGACWGTEPGMEESAGEYQISGRSWKSLSPSAAGGDLSDSRESQPKANPVAQLQSLDLEREQDSRDVVCGICMDKVWDKPAAERIFGILPNCAHAYCLGCLRTWRRTRQGFPLDVIKSCPQCRVHSSYIIPHKFWVSKGAEKEQLIRNFKARTGQIRCRFFMRGNGHCPFKSDCIYLHQLPTKAPRSGPP